MLTWVFGETNHGHVVLGTNRLQINELVAVIGEAQKIAIWAISHP